MSNMSKTQRKVLIWKLMDGFPGSHSNLTEGVIDAYVEATLDCSEEAITRSVEQYRSGRVEEHSGNYAPSSSDFARNVRMWVSALAVLEGAAAERDKLVPYAIGSAPPEPLVPLGPIAVDHGAGMIDMSKMSHSEKEAVLRDQGCAPNANIISPPKLNRI